MMPNKQYFKIKIKWIIRGLKFGLRYFFVEKPKGLDFSLRQRTTGIETKGNHGYALTQKEAFDDIMKRLDINEKDKFLDVGCGKGGTLYYASTSKYPFLKIGGIEVEKSLYDIAVNNFKVLNLSNIEIYHEDAINFNKYSGFNIFFLFNPFDEDIYERVIDNIFSTFNGDREDDRAYVICYGSTITDYIRRTGIVTLVEAYTEDMRETPVHIWKWEKHSFD